MSFNKICQKYQFLIDLDQKIYGATFLTFLSNKQTIVNMLRNMWTIVDMLTESLEFTP